ncbi:hypothetical protein NC652_013116 [Populus alba x Populus x berolinensis]|nr:hypothetical protein NC652_013116 [Populus alba x Populus x berolinensis]
MTGSTKQQHNLDQVAAHTKPNIFSASISSWLLTIGAFDEVGFKEKGMLVNWHGIPTALSLYAFCYCAHPVFPTLYTSMKNKCQFSNLRINGSYGLPNVWTKRSVADNLKPSNRKAKLKLLQEPQLGVHNV